MGTKIIIIGGVAAGTSIAVKIRRLSEEAEITLYEKDKYISYATCGLPYFVSDLIPKLGSLVIYDEELFKKRFKVRVKTRHEVIKINSKEKSIDVRNLESGELFKDYYEKLIIATGSKSSDLSNDYLGADNCFQLNNIEDALRIKDFLQNIEESKRDLKTIYKSDIEARGSSLRADALIVGGGYIGIELLEYFIGKFENVVLIEKERSILINFDHEIIEYLENYLTIKGLILLKNDSIKEAVMSDDNKIEEIITENNKKIRTKFVFFSTGFVPNTDLANECSIKLGKYGSIVVDDFLKTNIKDIFAIGDCAETKNLISNEKSPFYLATIASKQGRTAAYNILDSKREYKGSIGTSILKCFDIYLGKTGLSFKEAKRINDNALKIEFHAPSHSAYYPGSSMLHMLIVFDKITGEILGFEAIGKEGIDKKVDIISTAISGSMKISSLAALDLSYHPSCGSAKDSINIIGMIGENMLNNEIEFIDAEELSKKITRKDKCIILDVRTRNEYDRGSIEGSTLIPIDEIRDNLNKLDKDREIIIYCKTGYRAYLAYRILVNNGFRNIKCLNGSYLSWKREI